MKIYLTILCICLACPLLASPSIEMKTSAGTMTIELDEENAPLTTANFIKYLNENFYNGVVFHRVIEGFVIQGGGWARVDDVLAQKPTHSPIVNEASNGLENLRGTIAMARTSDPDSATSQFYINHVDNPRLNYPQPDGHGYAVFGRIVAGFDVLDAIAKVETGTVQEMDDVPLNDVTILSVSVIKRD